jgi:hypothetical protein
LIQVTLLLAVVGKASVQRCAAQPGMGIKEGRAQGRDPPLNRWQLLATLSKITSLQAGNAVTD